MYGIEQNHDGWYRNIRMENNGLDKIIRRMIAVLLGICMVISVTACSSDSNGKEYILYYTNSTKDRLIEQKCSLAADMSDEDKVKTLLDDMNVRSANKDEYVIKPENVNLLDMSIRGKTVSLNYTTTYKQMSMQTELLYRAAVVKTLTQIDDINYVHFYVDGKEIVYEDGSVIGLLKNSDFTESDNSMSDMNWRNVQLYYSDGSGTRLVKVKEMLAYNKNMPIEKMIVQRLINGPTTQDAYASLPSNVRLLGVSVVDKVCYVNLSEEFADELVNVASDVEIYSIVNSLCSLDYIDSVKIFINGDYSKTFKDDTSLDRFYRYNQALVDG